MLFKAHLQAVERSNLRIPLHLALREKTSFDVINMLLKVYPKAAELKDEDTNLPLHIAIQTAASNDVIKMLLEAYPKVAMVQDHWGCLPLCHAVHLGAPSDVIDLLFKAYPHAANVQDIDGCLPLHVACEFFDISLDLEVLNIIVSTHPEGIAAKDENDKLPSDLLVNCTEPFFLLHEAVIYSYSIHLVKLLLQAFPEGCMKKKIMTAR